MPRQELFEKRLSVIQLAESGIGSGEVESGRQRIGMLRPLNSSMQLERMLEEWLRFFVFALAAKKRGEVGERSHGGRVFVSGRTFSSFVSFSKQAFGIDVTPHLRVDDRQPREQGQRLEMVLAVGLPRDAEGFFVQIGRFLVTAGVVVVGGQSANRDERS